MQWNTAPGVQAGSHRKTLRHTRLQLRYERCSTLNLRPPKPVDSQTQ
jgi:hypothetical protein